MTEISRLYYFGERWDVPMLEDGDDFEAVQTETPVGELCGFCDEPIRDGQQGLMRSHLSAQLEPSVKPMHRECDLRAVIGGINHLRGNCICHGGTQSPDPEWATLREAALMAAAYLEGAAARTRR